MESTEEGLKVEAGDAGMEATPDNDVLNLVEDANDTDSDDWQTDLRDALNDLDSCDLPAVRKIANGNPFPSDLRLKAWLACLGLNTKRTSNYSSWNERFNLENQDLVKEAIGSEVEDIGERSRIESILTAYLQFNEIEFDKSQLQIVKVLVQSLQTEESVVFDVFEAVQDFIPCNLESSNQLFGLILQYHDPELSQFLDSKKLTPCDYLGDWMLSLIAGSASFEVIAALWDIYFQYHDPFQIYFLLLVMMVNAKDEIMKMGFNSNADIIALVKTMPCQLSLDDIPDFCALSQYYSSITPSSFRDACYSEIFEKNQENSAYQSMLHTPIMQSLCLPVSADELLETLHTADVLKGLKFFVIDCRPAEKYNICHLSLAFHLEASMIYIDPVQFDVNLDVLLEHKEDAKTHENALVGDHLCFIGSGCKETDQDLYMVVARLLKKHHKLISIVDGGFHEILRYCDELEIPRKRVLDGSNINIGLKEGSNQVETKGRCG